MGEDDLARHYAGASLLVFPSLYEGFGFPPLEAMAMGVPVAASNASSIPEVCGSAVEYFDPASVESIAGSIERVLNDEARRAELVRAGREQVGRYSWSDTVDKVAHVLRQAGS
jgi:glycosyltransferase involved in cell wall biosynthesis